MDQQQSSVIVWIIFFSFEHSTIKLANKVWNATTDGSGLVLEFYHGMHIISHGHNDSSNLYVIKWIQ